MEEQNVTAIVHDVVDAPIETIAESAQEAVSIAEETEQKIEEVTQEVDRVTQLSERLDSLESKLSSWRDELTQSAQSTAQEPTQTIAEEVPVEIAAPTPPQEKKRKYLLQHPMKTHR